MTSVKGGPSGGAAANILSGNNAAEKLAVNLTWAPSTVQSRTVGSTAVTYTVYRNDVSIGTTTTTTFQDKNTVAGGGKYTYTIVASDADGNRSLPSNTTVVTR